MKVIIKGILLDVIQKPYEFNGKQGITTKAVVYSEGKVQNIKIPAEQVQYYETMKNESVEVECSIFVNGKYSLNAR